MAKVAVNTLLRRTFTVAAENARVGTAAGKAMDSSRGGPEKEASPGGTGKREDHVFWMRDPKTGNWIPETHFGDVDVADLREKFLAKKAKL